MRGFCLFLFGELFIVCYCFADFDLFVPERKIMSDSESDEKIAPEEEEVCFFFGRLIDFQSFQMCYC